MIGWLRGQVREKTEEHFILDVNGVGYELTSSMNTLNDILMGEVSEIFVHTHLREDALILFGFSTRRERELFHSLLKVNGVGPKMAIKILSGGSVEKISNMIETANITGLSQLPKVGKKTAEQLVLSLKGKLPVFAEQSSGKKTAPSFTGGASRLSGVKAEIFTALMHLGFRAPDIEQWISNLSDAVEFEEGVRLGLRQMTHV